MPGEQVDGNDVDAVAARSSPRRSRGHAAASGPTLIEAVTYRWFGHYAGDKAAYREEDEVRARARAGDPLVRARAALDADAGRRRRRGRRGADRRAPSTSPWQSPVAERGRPLRRPLRGAVR